MIEKVNPSHPDKIADRIAGAMIDECYKVIKRPKAAVEVLIGHGECDIIMEADLRLSDYTVNNIVHRIAGDSITKVNYKFVPQDYFLSMNQSGSYHCGDNGIFKGMPLTDEEKELSKIARDIYSKYPTDGKYILSDSSGLVICQSNAKKEDLLKTYPKATVNPLGDWTGGTNVDTGCTNRKLGSDMGRSVTGGGLHGKDLSKADVSVNIYAFLKAQETGSPVELSCAIGDDTVDGKPYSEIVEIARKYIEKVGGFEKFAEWGLI